MSQRPTRRTAHGRFRAAVWKMVQSVKGEYRVDYPVVESGAEYMLLPAGDGEARAEGASRVFACPAHTQVVHLKAGKGSTVVGYLVAQQGLDDFRMGGTVASVACDSGPNVVLKNDKDNEDRWLIVENPLQDDMAIVRVSLTLWGGIGKSAGEVGSGGGKAKRLA